MTHWSLTIGMREYNLLKLADNMNSYAGRWQNRSLGFCHVPWSGEGQWLQAWWQENLREVKPHLFQFRQTYRFYRALAPPFFFEWFLHVHQVQELGWIGFGLRCLQFPCLWLERHSAYYTQYNLKTECIDYIKEHLALRFRIIFRLLRIDACHWPTGCESVSSGL